MMIIEVTSIKFAFALGVFMTTIIAGAYPFKRSLHESNVAGFDFPLGESLACGVFLGAGLLHMLYESSEYFRQQGFHYPVASLIAGSMFIAFLWLEHVGRELYHHKDQENSAFALIAMFMLSIHSLFAGSALGLTSDYRMSLVLFFAIIAHKWAASFAFAVYLTRSNLKRRSAYLCFAFFAFMTPLGVLLGSAMILHLSEHTLLVPVFSALAAGTFLYLGTLHGLEKGVLIKQCCDLKNFSFVVVGFAIMAIVARYV